MTEAQTKISRESARAHFLKILRWLGKPQPIWACGTPVAPSIIQKHTELAHRCLADMDAGRYLYGRDCGCNPPCRLE